MYSKLDSSYLATKPGSPGHGLQDFVQYNICITAMFMITDLIIASY